jgi:hypothetical protein
MSATVNETRLLLTLGELKEDELVLLKLLGLRKSLLVLVRGRESLRELKDGLVGS